jgi:hypothetical protein
MGGSNGWSLSLPNKVNRMRKGWVRWVTGWVRFSVTHPMKALIPHWVRCSGSVRWVTILPVCAHTRTRAYRPTVEGELTTQSHPTNVSTFFARRLLGGLVCQANPPMIGPVGGASHRWDLAPGNHELQKLSRAVKIHKKYLTALESTCGIRKSTGGRVRRIAVSLSPVTVGRTSMGTLGSFSTW